MSELKQILESAGISSDVTARIAQIQEAQVAAAVETRLDEAVKKMQEATEARFQSALSEATDGAVSMIAQALDEAVKEWFNENQEALVEGARHEMALAAIASLHESFAVLNLTEDKQLRESVEAMRKSVDLKESELAGVRAELSALNEAEAARAKGVLLKEAVEGMTDVAADRLKRLAESMGACSVDQYGSRLGDIKEMFKAINEQASSAAPAAGAAKPLNEGAGAGVDNEQPGQKNLNESEDDSVAAALRMLQHGRASA